MIRPVARRGLRRPDRIPRLCTAALLAFSLAVRPSCIAAQDTGSVTGTVIDAATREAVVGAQVLLVGSDLGTLSDGRGRFTITNVPQGVHTVRVVFLGYGMREQQVTVAEGGSARTDFELQVRAVTLDEIVVTGTGGEVERRKVGASVASVRVSQLVEQVPIASFGQSLQARVPGVRSVGTTGGVGAGRDLRVRGTTSFRLTQRPVVYIDGVRIDTNQSEWAGATVDGGTCCYFSGGAGEDRLHDLNPEEIERVEILKGAAAGTLYGSEASSGVIQIFTKSGRTDSAPRFTLTSSVGFNRQRANIPTKLFPEITNPANGVRARDANEGLIENGLVNHWDLTAAGGGRDVTYFAAGGFSTEDGSIRPNSMKRGNVRLNLRWVASEAWAFSLNTAYSRNRIESLQSGNNWLALLGNAVIGDPRKATEEKPYGEWANAVADIKKIDTASDASHWTGGLMVTFNPTESFGNRLSLGIDQVDEQKSRVLPWDISYTYLPGWGEKDLGYRTARNITADYLGTWQLGLSRDLDAEWSFGAQGFWETESNLMAIGQQFAGPGVTSIGAAATSRADEAFEETINVGVFAQNRLSWRDRAFATVGVRVDGNSAFGENYGLKAYPKADFAWDLTGQGFLPGFLSLLRLRAAAGRAGMFPGAFDHFRTYAPAPVLEDAPGVTPYNPGNADLKPETTTEFEAGFDAGLLDDRLGIAFSAFRADTRDALLSVRVAPSEGFLQPALQNAGHVRNTGWELSVTATPVNTSGLRWSTTLNLDGNRNRVLDLGPQAAWVKYFKGLDAQGNQVVDSALALGNYWTGFPVITRIERKVIKYDPATKRHTLSDHPAYVGGVLPTLNASWANTLGLGPVRVFVLLSAEKGAWFGNADRTFAAQRRTGDEYLGLLDFEKRDADGNPTVTAVADSVWSFAMQQGFTDKRDHVRIREMSLAWQMPASLTDRVGLGVTTLSLTGINLHWWDSCHCLDPNQATWGGDSFAAGTGFFAAPQPRQFLLGIRTRF